MIARAIILGNVGNKKHKPVKTGGFMTTLSVATKVKFIDSQGSNQEKTSWHNVSFFNKLSDVVNNHVQVGDLIYIEGDINNKKLDDERGARWVYSIIGTQIKLLPNNRKNQEQNPKNEKTDTVDCSQLLKDAPGDDWMPF